MNQILVKFMTRSNFGKIQGQALKYNVSALVDHKRYTVLEKKEGPYPC